MFSETFPVSNILRAMLVAFPPFPPFLSISIHLLFCSMLGSFGPGDCDILRLGTAFQAQAISFPVLRFYCSYCSTSCTCYTCRLKIPDVYSSRQPKACWKHLEAVIWVCWKVAVPVEHLPFYYQKYYKKVPVPVWCHSFLKVMSWVFDPAYWRLIRFRDVSRGWCSESNTISAQHISTTSLASCCPSRRNMGKWQNI